MRHMRALLDFAFKSFSWVCLFLLSMAAGEKLKIMCERELDFLCIFVCLVQLWLAVYFIDMQIIVISSSVGDIEEQL